MVAIAALVPRLRCRWSIAMFCTNRECGIAYLVALFYNLAECMTGELGLTAASAE